MNFRKLAAAGAIVGASVLGGAVGASVFGTANAATTTPASTTATTTNPQSNEDPTHEAGESAAREAAENNGTASYGPPSGSTTTPAG
jgi:hypothetical protein